MPSSLGTPARGAAGGGGRLLLRLRCSASASSGRVGRRRRLARARRQASACAAPTKRRASGPGGRTSAACRDGGRRRRAPRCPPLRARQIGASAAASADASRLVPASAASSVATRTLSSSRTSPTSAIGDARVAVSGGVFTARALVGSDAPHLLAIADNARPQIREPAPDAAGMHDAGASAVAALLVGLASSRPRTSAPRRRTTRGASSPEVTGDAGSELLEGRHHRRRRSAAEAGLVTSTVAAIAFLLISALLLLYYREPIARRCCGVRAGSEATADDEHRYLAEPGKTDLVVRSVGDAHAPVEDLANSLRYERTRPATTGRRRSSARSRWRAARAAASAGCRGRPTPGRWARRRRPPPR